MNKIVVKLLEIEKEYGAEIFVEKGRLLALIKDYFPDAKREQRLLEKGLELNIYAKFSKANSDEILFYKDQLIRELIDEHGMNEPSSQQIVQVWIRFIEMKRGAKILGDTAESKDKSEGISAIGKAFNKYKNLLQKDKKKAIDIYSKNLEKKENESNGDSAIYEKSSNEIEYNDTQAAYYENSDTLKKQLKKNETLKSKLKTQVYDLKRSADNMPVSDGVKDVLNVLLEKAQEDDAISQGVLGRFYFDGKMIDKDYKEAVKWFGKAAAKGDHQSQNDLGYCYFHGKGVAKNTELAISWLTKSAKQGNLSAILSLANCYYNGIGVKKDISLALSWYIKSAEKGNADSQFIIGECYYKGEGLSKSKIEALKWYEKAAAQNHRYAEERLEELKNLKSLIQHRNRREELKTNSMDWRAKGFMKNLIEQPISRELLENLEVHSNESSLTPKIENTITGYGLKLEADEYPLCVFNNSGSNQKFSNKIIFSTKGIYIIKLMRRRKFTYYADLQSIEYEPDYSKIKINNHSLTCDTLSEEGIYSLIKIIRDIAKEFK